MAGVMLSKSSWLEGLTAVPRRRSPIFNFCIIFIALLASIYFLLYTVRFVFDEDAYVPASEQIKDGRPGAAPAAERPVPPQQQPNYDDWHTEDLIVVQPESSSLLSFDDKVYNKEAKYGKRPMQDYHTVDFTSPLFHVNKFTPRATEGAPYFFMAPANPKTPGFLQILSRKDLSMVYGAHGFGREHDISNNFRVQDFDGQKHLTFWSGNPAAGHGQGYGIMMNDQYEITHNLSINTLNTMADSHEFQLTHDGGGLMTAYEMVENWDLTSANGPKDGLLQDSCFEEVDIATGKTRFTWRASDWFSAKDGLGWWDGEDYGHPTREGGWDFFHINSLEKTPDNNYLVVGRRLRVVTLVNGTSGEPIWQVGGNNNEYRDLSDGKATNFAYQHHARFVDPEKQDEIIMFDNAEYIANQPNPGCKDHCSRGLHIKLDHEAKTARVVKEYWHPLSVQARAEGSSEKQPNGNLLVAWGKVPGFTEFSAEGEVLLDVQTGPWSANEGEAHIYRIYSGDWKGNPTWNPEIAVHEGAVYASFNGATELAYWALFTGNDPNDLKVQYVVYRGGFETKMSLPKKAAYARVAALSESGELIGSTDAVQMETGERLHLSEPLQIRFGLQHRR